MSDDNYDALIEKLKDAARNVPGEWRTTAEQAGRQLLGGATHDYRLQPGRALVVHLPDGNGSVTFRVDSIQTPFGNDVGHGQDRQPAVKVKVTGNFKTLEEAAVGKHHAEQIDTKAELERVTAELEELRTRLLHVTRRTNALTRHRERITEEFAQVEQRWHELADYERTRPRYGVHIDSQGGYWMRRPDGWHKMYVDALVSPSSQPYGQIQRLSEIKDK